MKQETFLRPYSEMRPHLQAHRAWVERLRAQGQPISSGYLVDGAGQPGGGGLLLLEAEDYAAAEALVRTDPMVRSRGVRWQLHQWMPVVGSLGLVGPHPSASAADGPADCG